ncbi:MAG TPA: acyl carrier protein [Vicinamibacterales bacterium]|nr:acyl carrier protein [Vicinamibacterales bacterium]
MARGWRAPACWRVGHVRVTFPSLVSTSDPGHAPGAQTNSPDRFEHDTLEILRRLSPHSIEPTPQSELLADLAFDSLRVLELVGELEDHFNIAIPLNSLTHIRTVDQIVAEVRRLSQDAEPAA